MDVVRMRSSRREMPMRNGQVVLAMESYRID